MESAHTQTSLCVIIEKWLHDKGYTKLQVIHGTLRCGITTHDAASNNFYIGYVAAQHVVLMNDEDAWASETFSVYDPLFFDLLAGSLKFAKP